MLGYFKVKPVCLVYGWKDIAEDYRYVTERYFPLASKQNKNIDRQTRGRLYHTVFSAWQKTPSLLQYEMSLNADGVSTMK